MNLIDMHCDTLWRLTDDHTGQSLKENTFDVSIEKMQKAGTLAQFFACFVYMEQFQGESRFSKGYEHAIKMIERMDVEVAAQGDSIAYAGNLADIRKNQINKKISAILTIEEGGILDGDIKRLQELYERGVRLITLTWNIENCIGYPNSKEQGNMQKGLKPFGFEVIERMNELGMLIDVSHLSDGGFWDVLKVSKRPIIASHSNARALRTHPRNLDDDMLKALAEQGGAAGLNLYPYFLNEEGHPSICDMVKHVQHMLNVAGSDAVVIGTDFDGFDGIEEPLEIRDVSEMHKLYDALHAAGVTEAVLEKIWSKNALRIIGEVLK